MCPNQPSRHRPRILVDADSCPVVDDIVDLAHNHEIPVFLISNICHDYSSRENVSLIQVDNEPEAADLALMNYSRTGDIVVTQDMGVASMLLGKKAKVLSPRGLIYTEENIVPLLEMRHTMQKERRRGHWRGGGPKRFSESDRRRFLKSLRHLLSPGKKEGEDDQGD